MTAHPLVKALCGPHPDIAELTELVRERAYASAGPDDELDFYGAAKDLGIPDRAAWPITERLNLRAMRARGGI